MREIKFRSWNGERMQHGGFSIHATGDVLADSLHGKHPIAVMQYTGLKDSNGVEIYEGDIVKGVGKHEGQSEVFYGYGQWQPFSYLGSFSGQDYEVIGNIYQNQELLNG